MKIPWQFQPNIITKLLKNSRAKKKRNTYINIFFFMLQDTLNRHFKYLVHNIEIWITFQQLQAQLAPRNT